MSAMGRAILFCIGLGLVLVTIVWSIEYALGAPEEVYGVSELACMVVAGLVMLHRYADQILEDFREPRKPRGKTPA